MQLAFLPSGTNGTALGGRGIGRLWVYVQCRSTKTRLLIYNQHAVNAALLGAHQTLASHTPIMPLVILAYVYVYEYIYKYIYIVLFKYAYINY